jgi:protoporphyrinogen/coproporphyrinogen III oxidase
MIKTDVAIVGGGISGLATAFYLKQQGIRSVLMEKTERFGGLIRTDHTEGCDLEAGPDSFISTKPAVAKLAAELGIAGELIGSNDERRQIFIVRHRALTALPKGMVMMVPTDWKSAFRSPLFSLKTKGRFLLETFSRPRERPGDFSVRDLIADHFGEESLAYTTEPLLSGVYGGDSAGLSARSVLPRFVDYESKSGSLIKAARRERLGTSKGQSLFLSFRGGMETLTKTLRQSLGEDLACVHTEVQGIRREGDRWQIRTSSGQLETSTVVLACPAHVSSRLLRELDPALAHELGLIPYSSAILVTLLYRKKFFPHPLNGFGFLVPRPERRTIAAATWINTKFPSRIAPDFVAIRAFIVDPEASLHLQSSDADIISSVKADLKQFMGITSHPVHSAVYPWPKSMPQYVVGHAQRYQQILSLALKWPGLHLTSNYLDGVGIPDCIRIAETTAQNIQQKLLAHTYSE